ncbi:MAG: DNA repair protein RecO [Cellvibrionales bacterium]
MSTSLEPAWLLHRRPYGDGSLIADFFALQSGRFSAVVRGARRKTPGGAPIGLLQPYVPLLTKKVGRGELKTLSRLEAAGTALELTGDAVFSALYLNELLSRTIPIFEPLPKLFASYGRTLEQLNDPDSELALRFFELTLLEEIGFGIRFDEDGSGTGIDAQAWYRYAPGRGLVPCVFSEASDRTDALIPGEQLLNIADWSYAGDGLRPQNRRVLKNLLRAALGEHLGDKPLQSRLLLREFRKSGETIDS